MTDHQPNTYLRHIEHWNDRRARWSEKLERFSYHWLYRKGQHNVADPLSRMGEGEVNVVTRRMEKESLPPETPQLLHTTTPKP